MATVGNHSLTHSSVSGNYVYLTVQVTRDLQAVVFPEWRLPEDAFDLGVADLTVAQFSALATRLGRTFALPPTPVSLGDLHRIIARSMTSLSDLLKACRRFLIIIVWVLTVDFPGHPRRAGNMHRDRLPVLADPGTVIPQASNGAQRRCRRSATNDIRYNNLGEPCGAT